MVLLGEGFRPYVPPPPPVPEPLDVADTDRIIEALDRLAAAMAAPPPPPPPQIVLPEPDLTSIVTAVNGLRPGVDADEIAAKIVEQLTPTPPQSDPTLPILERITDALHSLDFRMQAPTAMVGGGVVHIDPADITRMVNALSQAVLGTVDVTDRASRILGKVTSDTLTARMLAKQPQQGWQLWLDTADTSNIYILEAVSGSTSTTAGFQGIRLPLDANGNIVGEVAQNTDASLTFSNRTTNTHWA